jgi:hypothetical protein
MSQRLRFYRPGRRRRWVSRGEGSDPAAVLLPWVRNVLVEFEARGFEQSQNMFSVASALAPWDMDPNSVDHAMYLTGSYELGPGSYSWKSTGPLKAREDHDATRRAKNSGLTMPPSRRWMLDLLRYTKRTS